VAVCTDCVDNGHDKHSFSKLGVKVAKLVKNFQDYERSLIDRNINYLRRTFENLTYEWTGFIKSGAKEEIDKMKQFVKEARCMLEQIEENLEIKIKRLEGQLLKHVSKLYSFEDYYSKEFHRLDFYAELKEIRYSEDHKNFCQIESKLLHLQKGYSEAIDLIADLDGFRCISNYSNTNQNVKPTKLIFAEDSTIRMRE